MKIWFVVALVWLIASGATFSLAADLTDAEKLALILDGKNQFTRAERMKGFEPEGVIDAVGRLVALEGKVYFKTADQSYIAEGRRFPYPELFFELHLTEAYAYRPLLEQGIVKGTRILHTGPLRIRGNWAYERPYHLFGLVWVDEVAKVETSPEGDWATYRKPTEETPATKSGAKSKKKSKKNAEAE
jgi:hypothetical protein